MLKKTLLLTFILFLGLSANVVSAQDEAETLANQVVEEIQELEVTNEELDIPGTGWFSRTWINVQSFLTRDPIKKADLDLKKASIELARVRNQINQNPDSEQTQARLEKATNKYDEMMNRIQERIGEGEPNDKQQAFMDKLTNHQLLHQQIMEKISNKVKGEVAEKIEEKRQAHLENIGETMLKLQNKEETKAQLKKVLQQGQTIRRISSLDLIEELSDLDPELQEIIAELKVEAVEVISQIKEAKIEIQANNEELRGVIKAELLNNKDDIKDPQVRVEIKQDIKDAIHSNRQENKEIRADVQIDVQGFRQGNTQDIQYVRDTIRNTFQKNRPTPEPTPQGGVPVKY